VSRSHWKRHLLGLPSTGLKAKQPGAFSPLGDILRIKKKIKKKIQEIA
jgi:hypothetical protein